MSGGFLASSCVWVIFKGHDAEGIFSERIGVSGQTVVTHPAACSDRRGLPLPRRRGFFIQRIYLLITKNPQPFTGCDLYRKPV